MDDTSAIPPPQSLDLGTWEHRFDCIHTLSFYRTIIMSPRTIGPLSLLLMFFFLAAASTLIDASTTTTTLTLESKCVNFTFPDEGGSEVVRELCFSGEATGPSPVVTLFENGTKVTAYFGGYTENYIFENELQGLVAGVFWKDDDNAATESGTFPCLASANGQDCAKCTICSDGSWSADCTNLIQGRNVVCEMPDPFFPFVSTYEYSAIGVEATTTTTTTPPGTNDEETTVRVPSASPFPGEPTTATSATKSAAASMQGVSRVSSFTTTLLALAPLLVLSILL